MAAAQGPGDLPFHVVDAYFTSWSAARAACRRMAGQGPAGSLAGGLQAAPFPDGTAAVAGPRPLWEAEWRRWVAAWEKSLKPLRVGHIVVRPLASLPKGRLRGSARGRGGDRGRGRLTGGPVGKESVGKDLAAKRPIRVSIRPGMAFGTGHHPTTRQVLWALQDATLTLADGARVVDVGTGSGILAVACALLGARRVLAVDTDPVAVQEARRHVRLHGVGSRVRVMLGSVDRALAAWGAGGADLVVANLTGPLLAELAGPVARLLRPGGRVVGAGFAGQDRDAVQQAWQEAGLAVELWGQWGTWAWMQAVAVGTVR